MRYTLTALVLASMLWAGFWPMAGMTEEPLAITPPSGFGSSTPVSGLTDPRGVAAFLPLGGFSSGYFVVEKSLNRVSFAPSNGTPTPFATGLAAPTDLAAPPGGGGPFGNFLYVTESGANRIARMNSAGAVTTFASLPAAPQRLAFSHAGGGSAFGDMLFVTLANGELRKIDAAGMVSPCASGLAGPQGLVFGPGGGLRTTVLYVAESTANKISKVDPACVVSAFASTGLTTPMGLAISPSIPWGPLDTTLYVVNAGTRVDRVDKNGTVTPFASGFMQVDTVSFRFSFPVNSRFNPSLRVSDVMAGTIVEVGINRPSVDLQLSGCNPCKVGQTFAVTLTVRNNGPITVPVEIKTGFRLPDGTPINFAPLLGNNKHFEAVLPPGFMFQGLWLSLLLPQVPVGNYCYEASLSDPELVNANSLFSSMSRCFMIQP